MQINKQGIFEGLAKNTEEIKPRETKTLHLKEYENAIQKARKGGVKWEVIQKTLKENGLDVSISSMVKYFKEIEKKELKLAKDLAKKNKEIDYKKYSNTFREIIVDFLKNTKITKEEKNSILIKHGSNRLTRFVDVLEEVYKS